MSKLPWSCTVEGVPAVVKSSSTKKRGWKAKVGAAARALWEAGPIEANVAIGVTFFYSDDPPDVDNMLKYTIDGLVGIVIADDSQVTDVHGTKRSIEGNYVLTGANLNLVVPLTTGVPFVQIKVLESPNLLELP